MKLIIFVHTCTKYEECRAKLLEETWASNNSDVVFITDNPDCKLKNHLYIGEYEKRVTYHPETIYAMFTIFLEKYEDYDWFMIIDYDSYLYVEKLKNYLSFFDKNKPYMIGDFLNWIDSNQEFCNDYSNWPSGGPGIVFSKSCLEKLLVLLISTPVKLANHDVWLHYLFLESDKSIKRVDCPGFHQYNASGLLHKYSTDSNNLVSVHLERNMDLIKEFHKQI